MRAGSKIKTHPHTNTFEIYRRLYGGMKVIGMPDEIQEQLPLYSTPYDYNICTINSTHGLDTVSSLSIIETLKIDRDLLTNENVKEASKAFILK